jgi:steroid delta-isomerase-like uncharacterized protein
MAQAEATAARDSVNREFVEEFLERWEDAWNSHDPERLLALMTDDIVYDDSAWPTTMRGHADVRRFLDYTWRAFPDLRFERVGAPFISVDGSRAAAHWRGRATNSGPIDPPGMAPTGKAVVMEGVDFQEYREGKVARLRIVFDMADVMRQLGALPAAGSRAERLSVRLASLGAKLQRR